MKIFSVRRLATVLDDPRIKLSGVAQVARISTDTIYAILNERRRPSADTLAALAFALDKPIEYFYEEEHEITSAQQKITFDAARTRRKVANV